MEMKRVFQAPANQQLEFLLSFAAEWNSLHSCGWWKTYCIRGFCILMRRAVYNEVGPFDEKFGQGNFEDDDLCLRLLKANYDLLIADDSYIHHFGSLSFGAAQRAYQELLWKNQEYFIRKWRPLDHDLLKKVAIHSAGRFLMEYTFNMQAPNTPGADLEINLKSFGFSSPQAIIDLYKK